MQFNNTLATAVQVASQFNVHQMVAFLLVANVLVDLAMIWRAWNRIFVTFPPNRRTSKRQRRQQGPKRRGRDNRIFVTVPPNRRTSKRQRRQQGPKRRGRDNR